MSAGHGRRWPPKAADERKREQRTRDAAAGFKRYEITAHADDIVRISAYVARLNKARGRTS